MIAGAWEKLHGIIYLQTMVLKICSCLFFVFSMYLNACNHVQQQNTGKETNVLPQYELVKDWPQIPITIPFTEPCGIGIDTSQNIVVFHRAGRKWPLLLSIPESAINANTIMVLDRQTGRIINSWGAGLFIMPHGLTVDRNNNIWITDVGLHQVFKFGYNGKLLMKLGEARIPGNDSTHFNRPTDVAVSLDGSFYVSDGYRNSRVIKFSASGKYLFEWGKKGDQPGEFEIPHAIDLDNNGNVYVADRENCRVQAFDSTGRFLREWKNRRFGKMYSVAFDKIKKNLLAVDYITNYIVPKGSDIILFDSTGSLVTQFGRSGLYDGPVCRYHDVAIDNEGNIYVCDLLEHRVQKFKRKSTQK